MNAWEIRRLLSTRANIKLIANKPANLAAIDMTSDIQPLSSFQRNTSEFIEQMKKTGDPIVLTVNGKAELVVQDAASYQKLLDAMEYLEAIAGIKEGLADVNSGRTRSLAEFQQCANRGSFR